MGTREGGRSGGEEAAKGPAAMRARLEGALGPAALAMLRRAGELGESAGTPVYLAGGPVRDLLLGRPLVDLDLTVEGDALRFAHDFAGAVGGRVRGHARFGTAILVVRPEGARALKLDLVTARRESYPRPGALPVVVPGSLRDDQRRRDFTLNSIALSLAPGELGRVLDPFGGAEDLAAGVLRVLHEGSFADDPTRLYRAVRFEARFGFRMEPESERLFAEAIGAGAVETVTGERLRQELFLLFDEPDPVPALRRLSEAGLCAAIAAGWRPGERAAAAAGRVARESGEVARARRLAGMLALLDDAPPGIAARAVARLRLAGDLPAWLDALREARAARLPRLADPAPMAPSEVARALRSLPEPALRLLALEAPPPAAARIAAYTDTWRHARLEVDGEDLKRLGLAPGPRFGDLLERLRDETLDGALAPDREAQLRRLRELTGPDEALP